MSLVETYMSLCSFVESHVQAPRERPAANKIRAIREIRVQNKIFVRFGLFVFKTCERQAANKIRVIREIRVQNKIFVKFVRFVFKIISL